MASPLPFSSPFGGAATYALSAARQRGDVSPREEHKQHVRSAPSQANPAPAPVHVNLVQSPSPRHLRPRDEPVVPRRRSGRAYKPMRSRPINLDSDEEDDECASVVDARLPLAASCDDDRSGASSPSHDGDSDWSFNSLISHRPGRSTSPRLIRQCHYDHGEFRRARGWPRALDKYDRIDNDRFCWACIELMDAESRTEADVQCSGICSRSWHARCLPSARGAVDAPWFCPTCSRGDFPQPDSNRKDPNSRTVLMCALEDYHRRAPHQGKYIDHLLRRVPQNKLHINQVDTEAKRGYSALMYAVVLSLPPGVFLRLLSLGASPTTRSTHEYGNALHMAMYRQEPTSTFALLTSQRIDVRAHIRKPGSCAFNVRERKARDLPRGELLTLTSGLFAVAEHTRRPKPCWQTGGVKVESGGEYTPEALEAALARPDNSQRFLDALASELSNISVNVMQFVLTAIRDRERPPHQRRASSFVAKKFTYEPAELIAAAASPPAAASSSVAAAASPRTMTKAQLLKLLFTLTQRRARLELDAEAAADRESGVEHVGVPSDADDEDDAFARVTRARHEYEEWFAALEQSPEFRRTIPRTPQHAEQERAKKTADEEVRARQARMPRPWSPEDGHDDVLDEWTTNSAAGAPLAAAAASSAIAPTTPTRAYSLRPSRTPVHASPPAAAASVTSLSSRTPLRKRSRRAIDAAAAKEAAEAEREAAERAASLSAGRLARAQKRQRIRAETTPAPAAAAATSARSSRPAAATAATPAAAAAATVASAASSSPFMAPTSSVDDIPLVSTSASPAVKTEQLADAPPPYSEHAHIYDHDDRILHSRHAVMHTPPAAAAASSVTPSAAAVMSPRTPTPGPRDFATPMSGSQFSLSAEPPTAAAAYTSAAVAATVTPPVISDYTETLNQASQAEKASQASLDALDAAYASGMGVADALLRCRQQRPVVTSALVRTHTHLSFVREALSHREALLTPTFVSALQLDARVRFVDERIALKWAASQMRVSDGLLTEAVDELRRIDGRLERVCAAVTESATPMTRADQRPTDLLSPLPIAAAPAAASAIVAAAPVPLSHRSNFGASVAQLSIPAAAAADSRSSTHA